MHMHVTHSAEVVRAHLCLSSGHRKHTRSLFREAGGCASGTHGPSRREPTATCAHAPSCGQIPTRTPRARESWGPRSHHSASSRSIGANPNLITFRRVVDSEVEIQTLLGRRGKRVSGMDSHAGRASRPAPDTVCPGPDGFSGSISGLSQASASLLPMGVRGWSFWSGKSWGGQSARGSTLGGGHLTGALTLELLSGSLAGICG